MQAPEKKDWLLDERLLQSQKLAAIGELSAGIAHEINNPLAIIRQEAEWMQLLLKKLADRDIAEIQELKDSLHQIVQQVDRCTEITRNLLDFARKRDPVIQAVDLNRIIEDMTMLVEKEARHNNITIIRQYDQDLPHIYSDAPQLRQVILNFLTNATQAIGQDGCITITTRRSGPDAVDLMVRDTGCGIPEENLGKIFDPFFTTKPPGKGTGLGLSICHGIILRLGGQITVDSQVGQGTTFTIILPLSRETELFAHD
ncbi:MAG: sensor histidine kinase [Thermodesulfobacteriota bacterium]